MDVDKKYDEGLVAADVFWLAINQSTAAGYLMYEKEFSCPIKKFNKVLK